MLVESVARLSREQHDYIVIDLGSEASPRWLTSRLYLLALLITLINKPLCLVFVETASGVRKRFVGLSSPDRVRWALARSYPWLESAAAAACAILAGLQCAAVDMPQLPPTATFQFDPTTGFLPDFQVGQLVQQFLVFIRAPQPPPGTPELSTAEWVPCRRSNV